MADKSSEIVALMSYITAYEAHLAKAKLEANGIKSVVQDQHTVGMNMWYSQAIGGVKLLVHNKDAKDALEILEGTDVENQFQCPDCKSFDLSDISSRNWKTRGIISLICFWLFGFPWLFKGKGFKCENCGYTGERIDFVIDQFDETDEWKQ